MRSWEGRPDPSRPKIKDRGRSGRIEPGLEIAPIPPPPDGGGIQRGPGLASRPGGDFVLDPAEAVLLTLRGREARPDETGARGGLQPALARLDSPPLGGRCPSCPAIGREAFSAPWRKITRCPRFRFCSCIYVGSDISSLRE